MTNVVTVLFSEYFRRSLSTLESLSLAASVTVTWCCGCDREYGVKCGYNTQLA